ncbi:MAG: arsenate reductase (glutaredoxin) [Enterobacterales bacterium]|nr:arsenate reductase (glutaredoxin) [Enterobacterales bacterium]
MSQFKIYHNPRCSKSRQTLALLEENAVDLEVIEYLKTPPTVKELKQVIALLKIEPLQLMRKNEDEYKQAGLDDKSLTKDQQIALMVAYPKVIERPIVIGQGKAAIGRPPESVLEII